MNEPEQTLDMGLQPLDAILTQQEITNRDLVAGSTEQLTHKQAQKSRKGRRVTANIQQKILTALNSISERKFTREELFNYSGK